MKKKLSPFSSVIVSPFKRISRSLLLPLRDAILSFPQKGKHKICIPLREAVRLAAISFFFLAPPSFSFAEDKITVFPSAPVEAYTVYGTLALFWLGIIGLIVIIKMKLHEIERIQKLGIDEEDKDAPLLE